MSHATSETDSVCPCVCGCTLVSGSWLADANDKWNVKYIFSCSACGRSAVVTWRATVTVKFNFNLSPQQRARCVWNSMNGRYIAAYLSRYTS